MNKVAVITGGAAGIGLAVVERLSKDDYIAVILDKDETGGEQAVAHIKEMGKQGVFVRIDVTQEAEVRESFAKINLGARPGRCPRQCRRRHLASTYGSRVSFAALAGNYRRKPYLDFSLLPGGHRDYEESKERSDRQHLFRSRFHRRRGPRGLCCGQGRYYRSFKVVGSRTRSFRYPGQCCGPGKDSHEAGHESLLGRGVGRCQRRDSPGPRGRTGGDCRSGGVSRRRCKPPYNRSNRSYQRRQNHAVTDEEKKDQLIFADSVEKSSLHRVVADHFY
jgi:hypothetical protein